MSDPIRSACFLGYNKWLAALYLVRFGRIFYKEFWTWVWKFKKSLLLFLLFPYYCHSWCLKSMTNKYYEYNFFIWRIFYGIDLIFKKNLALIGVERFLSTNLQMGPLLFFFFIAIRELWCPIVLVELLYFLFKN